MNFQAEVQPGGLLGSAPIVQPPSAMPTWMSWTCLRFNLSNQMHLGPLSVLSVPVTAASLLAAPYTLADSIASPGHLLHTEKLQQSTSSCFRPRLKDVPCSLSPREGGEKAREESGGSRGNGAELVSYQSSCLLPGARCRRQGILTP